MVDIIQRKHGFPEMFKDHPNLDFYVLNNEDIGFIASLIMGTNHAYQFALPYPADWDIDDDSMVVHAIEFLFLDQISHSTSSTGLQPDVQETVASGLDVFLAMLPEEFSIDVEGYSDVDDEEFKSQFAGPMYFGDESYFWQPSTESNWGFIKFDRKIINIIYFPPKPLDLKMPMYITFLNNSYAHVDTVIAEDFAKFERVMIRVWYHIRKLTPIEKSGRKEAQMLWIRPGS